MDGFTIPFLILLVFTLVSRILNEKANKKLEPEKKAELIDLFSKYRIYTFGALIFIIALYFASIEFNLVDIFISIAIYIILVIAYLITLSYISLKILKKNDFPDSYIKTYLVSTALRFVGLIVFFALIFYK